MKLNSLLLCVGVLTAMSCTNQSEQFAIRKFYPLSANCGSDNRADFIAGNAYLDVAAGTPQFFVGMEITGAQNLKQNAVVVGGTTLENANRNRPLVNQQVISYRLSKKVGAAPKPYITNINLPFSVDGEIFGPIQLISPELGLALSELIPSSGTAPSTTIEDFVDISVDVEFKGEFSATKTPFTTGILTFPIRAYKSLPASDCATFGFVKLTTQYDTTVMPPTVSGIDVCSYVGQSTTQLVQPAAPSCCLARGPGGGGGC